MKPLINSLPETVFTTKVDDILNWASLVPVVHAFRPGLLRHRAHADRRAAGGLGSFWRGAARYAAAIGSDDRRGHAHLQDGQADQAVLRPDARSEVRYFHGQLLELRRAFSVGLLGLQRRGQDNSRRRLRAGMPAAAGGADRRAAADSRQNDARALAGQAVRVRRRSRPGRGPDQMDAQEIYAALEQQFPGKVSDLKAEVFEPYLTVDGSSIVEVCVSARSRGHGFRSSFRLDRARLAERGKNSVVYHLFSYKHNHQIVLKVDLPRDNPKIATVEGFGRSPIGSSAKSMTCSG